MLFLIPFSGIFIEFLTHYNMVCSYELGPTIKAVSGSFGETTSTASVMSPEARSAYDEYLLQQAVSASLQVKK